MIIQLKFDKIKTKKEYVGNVMNKIRLGAVNWDASLPKDSYFGFYQINSLSPSKYRTWTPFYADIIDKEKISYHTRTPEEYEREMQYAIDAGIDYFAYVWYPTEGSLQHEKTSFKDCSHKVHELNYARRLYERSNLKTKLNMCAILGAHPFTDADLSELIDAFQEPYYEKISARPLLYVYGGYREEIISKIISMCNERGTPQPYVAVMVPEAKSKSDFPLADALSDYTVVAEGVSTHAELIEHAKVTNRSRLLPDFKLIPTFTVGWNPTPRIERPTPWTTRAEGGSIYPSVSYAPRATAKELYQGAESFVEFIKSEVKPANAFIDHVLTFSWNEFEEGGYFCPTYTKEGETDASRIEVFAKISKLFHALEAES